MPLRGASVVLSVVVLCLRTTTASAVPLPVEGPTGVVVSQENENVLLGDVNHQLLTVAGELDDKSEGPEPIQNDTVAICIIWPVNDTVLPVGDVMLVFERHGFSSREIPIEVLIPQNGEATALMTVDSNNIILSADQPYTQLVTIFATVRGRRVSAAVVFSTAFDKDTIASARAPLPADAAWGLRSEAVSPPPRELDTGNNRVLMVNKAGLEVPQRTGNTVSISSPIYLVFIGSLNLDGQKYIWLQQLERLSRARFAPKYLTFHEDEESRRAHSIAEGVAPWKEDDVEVFKRRLHDADVPLIRARTPRMHSSCISDRDGDKSTDKSRRDTAFRAVLESIDSAGGDPSLMSPPWAREFFLLLADAIKSASPDVLVVANSATLGDVVLTRAARWAMNGRGLKIIMDFPNIKPTDGIDVDLLVTPSHYAARHPDIEALAESTRASVVVIPPGIEVASSPVISSVEEGVSDAQRPENRSGGSLHDLACSSDVLAELGCRDPDCHMVGYVGRLAPEKGPGLFLAVAEVLAKLLPCAVFVIVGDGPLRLPLEAMAERLGLARRAHFVGWVDGVDLEHILAGLSLLFNPSLMSSETFSIVNIQAMAVGTPVAAFGTGGMLEYLSANVNALVLDEAEPGKVASALAELLLDRPRLDAFAESGRTHIISNFGADTAVKRWAELYESLVDVR